MKPASTNRTRRPWYRPSLTMQIMIGLIVGAVIGWLRPDWGNAVYFLRDIFINLIKSIIAPLIFSTIERCDDRFDQVNEDVDHRTAHFLDHCRRNRWRGRIAKDRAHGHQSVDLFRARHDSGALYRTSSRELHETRGRRNAYGGQHRHRQGDRTGSSQDLR